MKEAATAQIMTHEESKAFSFTAGLYGFPSAQRYTVIGVPRAGEAVKQMVALDEPGLGFTLVDPFTFFQDYAPQFSDEDLHSVGAHRADQIVVMAIANVPGQGSDVTVNLKAPLIFNPHNQQARQVILTDDRYQTRQRLSFQ